MCDTATTYRISVISLSNSGYLIALGANSALIHYKIAKKCTFNIQDN